MGAAGTVTKKFAMWLVEMGCVDNTDLAQMSAGEATKEMPKASTVLKILSGCCDGIPRSRRSDRREGYFWIHQVEPGKLWLSPLSAGGGDFGPIPVPLQVNKLCKPGWDIGGLVEKVGERWQFVGVWNVSH
jgi:hypothetical protein